MSGAEPIIKTAMQFKGSQHQWAIQSLRRYMNISTDLELTNFINQITDPQQMRILQEAGLRSPLYAVAISRMNLLIREQEGVK